MKKSLLLKICVVILVCMVNVKSDLPVHCLSRTIEGKWLLHMSMNDGDKNISCGHFKPDSNLDHLSISLASTEFKERFQVGITLERPNLVQPIRDHEKIGTWTMVYDEGFEFRIRDYTFFAFSKYAKSPNSGEASDNDTIDTDGYYSICNKTFLGWFRDNFNNHWGCFWAEKIVNSRNSYDYNDLFSETNDIKHQRESKIDKTDKKVANKEKKTKQSTSLSSKNDFDLLNHLSQKSEENSTDTNTSLDMSLISNYKIDSNGPINLANGIFNPEVSSVSVGNTFSGPVLGPQDQSDDNDNINKKNSEEDKRKKKNFLKKEKKPNNEENGVVEVPEKILSTNLNNGPVESGNSAKAFIDADQNGPIEQNNDDIPHLDIYYLNKKLNKETRSSSNFLEVTEREKLKKEMFFQPDYAFVNRINDPKSKSLWKAAVPEDFIGKTYTEMRGLLGNSKGFKNTVFDNSFLELEIKINHQSYSDSQYDDQFDGLPKSFDWRNVNGENFDSPIKKQGSCGSCYAIAATSIMESRLRIMSKNRIKPILSASSIIGCSRYNQGCKGGYPFLVGKHGKEFGFVEESCQDYSNLDKECNSSCFSSKKYRVRSYGYVGGYYGGCSEKKMMEEIKTNGPIVVAINASPELYYYKTGIFKSNVRKTEGRFEKGVKPWEYTNHAVVCLGWGEEEIEGKVVKYWILKNSWGQKWGDLGYFKIVRGQDIASVEAQGVFMSPSYDDIM